MPRQHEIESAFRDAIVIGTNGRRTVTSEAFVKQLEKYNRYWSLKQANNWIEMYVTTFTDISSAEGEARTFMLLNPRGEL
ncbi:DNA polymerase V [Enterobacter mori]|uniref:DNA polymerase V n=1 Tax=Enterobacter mori TaxID=539813 RepID=UPI00398AB997